MQSQIANNARNRLLLSRLRFVHGRLDTVARLLDDWGPCTFGAAIKIAESHGEILDRADLRELFGAGFLKTDNDGNLELVGGES